MGAGGSKKVLALIGNEDNEAAVKEVFDKLDKDKSGALSQDEFTTLGKGLYAAIVEDATNTVKEEVMVEIRENAPLMGGMMAKVGGAGVSLLADEVKPADVAEFVADMFVLADKNKDGQLSFEEFKTFLATDANHDREERKKKIRGLVADNIAQTGGIHVHQQKGAVTKNVDLSGVPLDAEKIRNHQ